ncbi:MAG: deoxyribonuclease V [Cyanobacteria bacterium]|nr:deoxyribonuclease V [Cyanobacteriota bacterium]MDW8201192.1 deoxyribonuclease V [Cyanobacteriota bacterium SKYGB_h_bin112]
MNIYPQHDWNLPPHQAISLQRQLAQQVVDDRPLLLDDVRLVAGVDVSVKGNQSHGAVVVLTFPDLTLVETCCHQMITPFPYIPGLLSFRELPVLLAALQQLRHEPDVLLVDGMGRIHPRRFGIACHLGLWLQKPTIGCGKTPFVGTFAEPAPDRGSMSELVQAGETIGAVLRTRSQVKPVFISVGHLADLPTAIELTLRCTTRYRLPEPIRLAHQAAGKFSPC